MTIRNNQQQRRGNFYKILIEDCNPQYNSDNKCSFKFQEQFAAPIYQNIKTSPVATTNNKAARTDADLYIFHLNG